MVLDAGDWKGGGAEERRLLYVAMTRAKETLSLFQSRDNPFLCALGDSEAVRTVEPKVLPQVEEWETVLCDLTFE